MTRRQAMEERFPLHFQIACFILTTLFVWCFIISRDPRTWRKLYQSVFERSRQPSVRRNKAIDSRLRIYGLRLAMLFLVADVACFVLGVTDASRKRAQSLTPEEKFGIEDLKRIESGSSKLPVLQ